ncbi:hypothetical protein KVR01_012358 [Diaporthe batatas]|uniref:uncharacterized protein n=1 Tax=Diaporthe batatas TaxID=748121 RepID=UPI001D048A53|nr:uncharacterized protein KVR01_012358 [Diaporthe batatas]KAG8157696.1 hypothetical protein KVR01_012358 [Diaporthe batatas]
MVNSDTTGSMQLDPSPYQEKEASMQPGGQHEPSQAPNQAPGQAVSQAPRQDANPSQPTVETKGGSTPQVVEVEDPFKHLPDHEKQILKRQLDVPAVKITYITLYRYATSKDKAILAVASVAAVIAGILVPMMTVLFGGLAGTFQNFTLGRTSQSEFAHETARFSLYFVYLAIGEFIMVYVATTGFLYAGEDISSKIREQFLAAILRQNIAFFDELGSGEITTRITADTNLVQKGISEKVGLTLTAVSTFLAAFVISYIRYWKLALIVSTTIVAIVVTMAAVYIAHFAQGGTVAEEVISSIRNTTAFHTQDKLARQYDSYLVKAEKMAIMLGAFALGNVAPNLEAITSAVAAANKIYAVIDRASPLNPESTDGIKLDVVRGNVELRNIRHIYPSRPDVVVMDDVNLMIPAGKSTALVGASGSGKSTIVGLVERFYDPVGGDVYIDDHKVKDLNLAWLRRQISLVSQEPVLFATSIYDNIKHGLIGTAQEHEYEKTVRELVEFAAKTANAHEFITNLPEGYETNIGERGFLLSGGQKQRIAIARAIVSDPRILLLDEATSALDIKTAQGRTTVIIAHRLSTIRHADNIVVMSKGRIVEQGTHDELFAKEGAYYNLVEAQRVASIQASRSEDEDIITREEGGFSDPEFSKNASISSKEAHGQRPGDLQLDKTPTNGTPSRLECAKGEDHDGDNYTLFELLKFIASLNRREWKAMVFGISLSVITGGGNPTQAVFLAKSITALSLPLSEHEEIRSRAKFWSLMFLMLAFVQLIALIAQGVALSYCAERLTHRVRDLAFRHILRQDVAYFDKRSTGALTSFLSTETSYLAGISGTTLMTLLLLTTTLVASSAIGLAVGWRLSLVCISVIPLLLASGYLRLAMLVRFQKQREKVHQQSASYACEATSAIRTVASLTREDDVLSHYREKLAGQSRHLVTSILKSSLLYAASQSLQYLGMALGFWYGGGLFSRGEYTMFQFFLCFIAVIFGAESAGTVLAYAPDMAKARNAAATLKALFDRKPEIDNWSDDGASVPSVEGHIEFKNVHFRYSTRPDQPVLRGLNLTVKPGQYVAFVGASGCGKSTAIALLERFYDPTTGGIFVDGNEISSLNINEYRSHLALVSQEPTMYQGTIRDNILLGTDRLDVSEDEIVRCCRDANIHDFIISLPGGMDTLVGSKGCMLSGGQKQRLAIARALLRRPKVLLLDEATSALDTESEKVVQAALDAAMKGCTTIAVAHRVSTIKEADAIHVFHQGRIIESGTYDELMQAKGAYFELVNLQSLS